MAAEMIVTPSRRAPTAAPVVDADLYSDDVLADSRGLFARIRHAGPVVWLPRHRMYAIGRFADVRAALRDDTHFRSGDGVAANALVNRLGRHTTLSSDDEVHTARRRVLMRSLGAKAVAAIEEPLAHEAAAVVGELLGRAYFDAASDFASRLPTRVVSELVGVDGSSDRLLRWAAATFEVLGPINRRGLRAVPRSLGLLLYSRRLRPGGVASGSWAASVFDAQRAGELTFEEAKALVIDFVAPSLDTTILASTHLLWTLARHPDAWTEIRADPALTPAAVVENVRIASPIRAFTRQLAADHEIDGITLPAGARVALLFGAANLDETHFPDPERFDLHRSNGQHVGWGNGPHTCVGIHLAKLEMRLLLDAMVPRVDRIVAGTPGRLRNNTLQGIDRLPVRFVA
ncbi:cytochrome P450 [Conexibacter stalactiti]|uniref:Cytochrome P450 n=1 Tax=Conexibacter stalactiti TaxID=1940611 RepID=A0ABU4HK54_9ACTN|nr:cytochrome P450 [Conexibacter stalactiti]MDW5593084.1 cytochrome P450 [Conexibacter stalactiti]MEC5033725.1 cytochrome P450 [Conexibacter stalactiti]